MRAFSLVFLCLLIYLPGIRAQVTFSVICNAEQNQTEVIVSSNRIAGQTLLKDNFPNRAVAEEWMHDNYPQGTCITLPANSQAASTSSPQTQRMGNSSGREVRRGARTYGRILTLRAGLTPFLNADTYYPNIDGGRKTGFNLGGEFTFGKQVKWGGGIFYTRLIGGLDDHDFGAGEVAYLEALKGRFLIKSPIRVGKKVWILLNFHVNYYFNTALSNGEDFVSLAPPLEEDFGGLGGGIAVDVQRAVIGVDFEAIYNLLDVEGDGNLNLLDFYIGFAL